MSRSKQLLIKNWLNKPQLFSSALLTLQTQVFMINFIKKTLFVAFLYLIVSNIINEYAIYSNIFSHNFSFLLKMKIAVLMFMKSLTMFGPINMIVLLSIALLVGINCMLVLRKLAFVRSQKNIQWTFGTGIVTLASTSCPGCGFSLLSLTGLTSAIPGIPLHGTLFSFLILVILSITALYNLQSLNKVSCSYSAGK